MKWGTRLMVLIVLIAASYNLGASLASVFGIIYWKAVINIVLITWCSYILFVNIKAITK